MQPNITVSMYKRMQARSLVFWIIETWGVVGKYLFGQIWPSGLMFKTPCLRENVLLGWSKLDPCGHYLWIINTVSMRFLSGWVNLSHSPPLIEKVYTYALFRVIGVLSQGSAMVHISMDMMWEQQHSHASRVFDMLFVLSKAQPAGLKLSGDL